jgi:hypothetical protein
MKLHTLTIDRAYSYSGEDMKPLKAEVCLKEGNSEMKITLSALTIGKIINLIAAEVQANAAAMAKGVAPGLKESVKIQLAAAQELVAIEG